MARGSASQTHPLLPPPQTKSASALDGQHTVTPPGAVTHANRALAGYTQLTVTCPDPTRDPSLSSAFFEAAEDSSMAVLRFSPAGHDRA
jgi:hypothetical protein